MSKEQKGFIVYGDTKALADELTDEQLGQLFRAMLTYFTDGKAPKFAGVLKFVWITVRQQMDRDMEKYEKKCEKNRESIKAYWDKVKTDTNENERKRTKTNATNKDTNTKTKTKKDTDTDTTTNTNTDTKGAALEQRGGGGECDDDFDLWKKLTADDIDRIYEVYPDSGGFLIEEVVADVKTKRKKVKNARTYILGYAKRVSWDDKAEHGTMPWEVS